MLTRIPDSQARSIECSEALWTEIVMDRLVWWDEQSYILACDFGELMLRVLLSST